VRRRAVLIDVHGIAVDLWLWAWLDAIGLCLLAFEILLGRRFLNGAIGFRGEDMGGNALVESQQGAIAGGVGATMVGAEMVVGIALGESTRETGDSRWRREGYICGFSLQLVEEQAVLEELDEGVGADIAGKRQRFGVAQPAARKLQGGIAKTGLLEVAPDWRKGQLEGGGQWARGGKGALR
jgi:hypothetical protein